MMFAFLDRIVARVAAPSRREPWWISLLLGLELASGGTLAVWGAFSLAFVDFSALPVYEVLVRWIPGHAWGGMALLVGIVQVGVAALDFRRMRCCLAVAASLVWSAIAVALFRGEVMPPGVVTQGAWAMANLPTMLLLRPRWR